MCVPVFILWLVLIVFILRVLGTRQQEFVSTDPASDSQLEAGPASGDETERSRTIAACTSSLSQNDSEKTIVTAVVVAGSDVLSSNL